ncbi:hypothetical protein SK128_023962 [Halocaridina rubra]|uniref:TIMELESS-interacting protein n=1 Tax=Halocaridina rubra TaxID=373956 RepID=A0AAN9ACN3_HALRR
MELDIEEMFGIRGSRSRRNSSDSGGDGSGSEGEDEGRGGHHMHSDEAIEVPDPETAAGERADTAAKIVKPKRVILNPMPKLDAVRIAGPRGIPVIQKCFKNVKFQGKGHEKEDLDILMMHLEHWAHRLFPKLPFKDIVEQMEKLGNKKPVQVMMKKIRLDMFVENENEIKDEDDVRRGTDYDETPEPVIDVFDELLGQTDFPTAPPASLLQTGGITDEQRERLERNKRLAEEKRQARLREQQEHESMLGEIDHKNHDEEIHDITTSTVSEITKTRKGKSDSLTASLITGDEFVKNNENSGIPTITDKTDDSEFHIHYKDPNKSHNYSMGSNVMDLDDKSKPSEEKACEENKFSDTLENSKGSEENAFYEDNVSNMHNKRKHSDENVFNEDNVSSNMHIKRKRSEAYACDEDNVSDTPDKRKRGEENAYDEDYISDMHVKLKSSEENKFDEDKESDVRDKKKGSKEQVHEEDLSIQCTSFDKGKNTNILSIGSNSTDDETRDQISIAALTKSKNENGCHTNSRKLCMKGIDPENDNSKENDFEDTHKTSENGNDCNQEDLVSVDDVLSMLYE